MNACFGRSGCYPESPSWNGFKLPLLKAPQSSACSLPRLLWWQSNNDRTALSADSALHNTGRIRICKCAAVLLNDMRQPDYDYLQRSSLKYSQKTSSMFCAANVVMLINARFITLLSHISSTNGIEYWYSLTIASWLKYRTSPSHIDKWNVQCSPSDYRTEKHLTSSARKS